ncbi:protein of unknown function DUF523 [Desulforamulus reducens MI-1]|uniref:Uncharacterized protein n=1 Tax=Desulforamulus reducens (strain ATCC BAA-1160 / DSM 100696 / MI-1) TaxID=349161 RepID=A4J440_DESRM|nr:DUF523 domain-containing protein [Desulforamulus reducens]ABO49843.1 protein of unknown function DUF523 [Desulforamulus reducens MI-1]
MILVSACLAGVQCRYNGKDNFVASIAELVKQGKAIPVCPEELGGLPTPREPVDIEKGNGFDILKGKGRLLTESGTEVTEQFLQGAEKVLQIAREQGVKMAVLKERSPSCGSNRIYNRISNCMGDVKRELVQGMGVTAAILKNDKITVLSEEQLDQNTLNRILQDQ